MEATPDELQSTLQEEDVGEHSRKPDIRVLWGAVRRKRFASLVLAFACALVLVMSCATYPATRLQVAAAHAVNVGADHPLGLSSDIVGCENLQLPTTQMRLEYILQGAGMTEDQQVKEVQASIKCDADRFTELLWRLQKSAHGTYISMPGNACVIASATEPAMKLVSSFLEAKYDIEICGTCERSCCLAQLKEHALVPKGAEFLLNACDLGGKTPNSNCPPCHHDFER